MRQQMKHVFTLVAGVALMAIPTIATAHGGNDDANVVHACIGDVSRIVRIVGVNGICISSPAPVAETPAHWGIQGPQGVPGTNGTNGTNGAPGTNGIDGRNGTNGIDGTSVTFVGSFTGNANGCPNGGAIFQAAGNVLAYVCNGLDGTGGSGTRAAGPCFDSTNRYVDCGNGTVTDTVTGLIWLKQSDCLGDADWKTANEVAVSLKGGDCGLTDGSSPGDWRLPTKAEWAAIIASAISLRCHFGFHGGPPSFLNDAGTACYGSGTGSSFAGVASAPYWSSTSNEADPSFAWFADLLAGSINFVVDDRADDTLGLGKGASRRAWPVRGAPR